MKKLQIIVLIIAMVVSAFMVFIMALNALVEWVNWGYGLQNAVLTVPAAFVAVCYFRGVIQLCEHFGLVLRGDWSKV